MYPLINKLPVFITSGLVIVGCLVFFARFFSGEPIMISSRPIVILTDPTSKLIALLITIIVFVWAVQRLIKAYARKK